MITLTLKSDAVMDAFHLFLEQTKDIERVYFNHQTQEYYISVSLGSPLDLMTRRIQSTGCVETIEAKAVYRVK